MATVAPSSAGTATSGGPSLRQRLADWTPQLVLTPSLIATFVYVFMFTGWTLWISLSTSTLLPDYSWGGFANYVALWSNRRWITAFTNLFVFGSLYVVGSTLLGLLLAILIDQRVKGESVWRTIFLYPLAVSFVVTGTVWRWILNPTTGVELLMHDLGWAGFRFDWIVQRELAIYTVVITGMWHASGFCMALFLAGLRSVEGDLIKAAQIDGAGMGRIYRKIILPAIRPIFVAVLVILLQFAIKTYDLVLALTTGGPGISTTVPAIFVYELMFPRGQMGVGAAGAIMILLALAIVLVPYLLWTTWQARRAGGGGHG